MFRAEHGLSNYSLSKCFNLLFVFLCTQVDTFKCLSPKCEYLWQFFLILVRIFFPWFFYEIHKPQVKTINDCNTWLRCRFGFSQNHPNTHTLCRWCGVVPRCHRPGSGRSGCGAGRSPRRTGSGPQRGCHSVTFAGPPNGRCPPPAGFRTTLQYTD